MSDSRGSEDEVHAREPSLALERTARYAWGLPPRVALRAALGTDAAARLYTVGVLDGLLRLALIERYGSVRVTVTAEGDNSDVLRLCHCVAASAQDSVRRRVKRGRWIEECRGVFKDGEKRRLLQFLEAESLLQRRQAACLLRVIGVNVPDAGATTPPDEAGLEAGTASGPVPIPDHIAELPPLEAIGSVFDLGRDPAADFDLSSPTHDEEESDGGGFSSPTSCVLPHWEEFPEHSSNGGSKGEGESTHDSGDTSFAPRRTTNPAHTKALCAELAAARESDIQAFGASCSKVPAEWLAGFFEARGLMSLRCPRKGGSHPRVQLSYLGHTDERPVLERIHRSFGVGSIKPATRSVALTFTNKRALDLWHDAIGHHLRVKYMRPNHAGIADLA